MFFQNTEIKISSGYSGTQLYSLPMVQGITSDYTVQRNNINIIGNSKSLQIRPIINYSPVRYSIDLIKSDKIIEEIHGLTNPTGVAINIGTSSSLIGYGVRDIETTLLDDQSNRLKSNFTIVSGALQSYRLNATVGDVVRLTLQGEGVDYRTNTGDLLNFNTNNNFDIIKSEDIRISGINFSGFGISGFSIQSLNIDLQFSHKQDIKLGDRYPERKLSNAQANISFNGFLEGFNYNSGIFHQNNEFPSSNIYYITLNSACSLYPSTTYEIRNPYIESFNFGASIGSFVSIRVGMYIPLGFTKRECITGSNLIIT